MNDVSIGDPLVFLKIEKDNLEVKGGVMSGFDYNNRIINVSFDSFSPESMHRAYKRYPASFYAEIKIHGIKARAPAIVKDVSNYGMLIMFLSSVRQRTQVSVLKAQ